MVRTWMTIGAAAMLLAACGKPASEAAAVENPPAAVAAPVSASDTPMVIETPPAPAFDVSATKAGLYKIDPTHGYIVFSYDHMGYSKPMLRWGSWTGDLNWDPAAPANSTINVGIDAASVDSGVPALDEHIVGADYLDAATYPQISFVSTGIEMLGGAAGKITGDLTIKGVTKPVTLDVTINRAANDDFAKAYKLGFSATGKFKRSDFGVDNFVPVVGDEITLMIEAEFFMPREELMP